MVGVLQDDDYIGGPHYLFGSDGVHMRVFEASYLDLHEKMAPHIDPAVRWLFVSSRVVPCHVLCPVMNLLDPARFSTGGAEPLKLWDGWDVLAGWARDHDCCGLVSSPRA